MALTDTTRTALRLIAAAGTLAATAGTFRPPPPAIAPPHWLPLGSPAAICDHASILTGPAQAPSGAVTVPAGDNSKLLQSLAPKTTYWFAPGTHTLSGGVYAQ